VYLTVPFYEFSNGNPIQLGSKVIETSKDSEVVYIGPEDEAKRMCKFYNSGGGFNGWTPSFITRPTNYKFEEDILE
jgi:hypothetical protein